jgi:pyridoxal phosphate enzyme (YggS family)
MTGISLKQERTIRRPCPQDQEFGRTFTMVCQKRQLRGLPKRPKRNGNSMNDAVEQLGVVRERIAAAERDAGRPAGTTSLVAVSKTFDAVAIRPVIEAGQRVFGENRVQEAQGKWRDLKTEFPHIELHLIGPLQSNKTKEAVSLFDVIETVDREKIAAELAKEIARQGRSPRLYVQVNTGSEPQKAGIEPREAVAFVKRCLETHGLTIDGLMCIPPAEENPGPHFALLAKLAREAGVEKLSMGMSGDYELAVAFGATSVRVGSAIFGAR